MVASSRRVVFTGIGVLSSVGSELDAFYDALLDGKCGIRPITLVDTSELSVKLAGEIPDFAPKTILDKEARKSLRMMVRTIQLGVCASTLALRHAGFEKGKIDPDRFGVEFGCGMMATELDDLTPAARASLNCKPDSISLGQWGSSGMNEIPPLWMLKYLPNMPACHVSIQNDARGPNNSITASDAAGLLAVGEAFRILGRDLADFMIVGGTESKLNPLSLVRYSMFYPLVKGNVTPEETIRPYDRDRKGTIFGEASGVFALEDLDHARRRGVTIHGEVTGFASGFDHGRKGPVLAAVIRKAMKEAGITPDDVDHVNGHGIGTNEADAWEARAIHEVFGDSVPVYTGKSAFGHSGAAGGVLELIVSVLALQRGQLPATLHHDHPARDCPISVHTGKPRPVTKDHAVKISFTDMGHCAAVVIRRWTE